MSSRSLDVRWGREVGQGWVMEETYVCLSGLVCAIRLGGAVCVPSDLLLPFMTKKT